MFKRANHYLLLIIFTSALALGQAPKSASNSRYEKLPEALKAWIYAEQKLNVRNVDPEKVASLDNFQDKFFAPESGEIFEIKSYWVPEDTLYSFEGSGLNNELRTLFTETREGKKWVRFIVHPESESFYETFLLENAKPAESFFATSTASSRTLLVWSNELEPKAFFAKLSLNKEIGSVVRTIPKGEVSRSLGTNNLLAASKNELPSTFSSMPEVFGIMPKGMERGGSIIRMIPDEVMTGKKKLLPLFSLYAKQADGKTLVEKLSQQSGMKTDAFIKEKVLVPFLEQWVDLIVNHGISMEPHAQNVLIELNEQDQLTGRFFHRDFGGFNVDLEYRSSLGKKMQMPTITSIEKDYHQASHGNSIQQSLDNYFLGGFVYNLDQNDNLRPRNSPSFRDITMNELKRIFKERTGLDMPTKNNAIVFSEISKQIMKARKKHLSQIVKGMELCAQAYRQLASR